MKRETFLKTVHDHCGDEWGYQVFEDTMFFLLMDEGDNDWGMQGRIYLQHVCVGINHHGVPYDDYHIWTTYWPNKTDHRCSNCDDPIPHNVLAVWRFKELEI